MKEWVRRVRGAVGMGLTWAAGWSPVGAAVGLGAGVAVGGVPLGAALVRYVVTFAVLGFLGGTIFAGVVRVAEGRRRFDELSLPRFAMWGATGGFLLGLLAIAAGVLGPGLSLLDAVIVGVSTLLGTASAAGTLALARRADERDLLDGSRDIDARHLAE